MQDTTINRAVTVSKQKVVTFHGIDTDGSWQEQLSNVLEPHFENVPIKYDEYRSFGGPKLLFGPTLLVFSIGVLVGDVIATLSFPSAQIWGLIGLGLIGAFFEAHKRRIMLVKKVKRILDEKVRLAGERPHIIAHSLGTFLVSRALRKYPNLRFERVILCGSVLPRFFDWRRLYDRSSPFREIRNEVGRKDAAVWLAGLFRFLAIGLGNAGLLGFAERQGKRFWLQPLLQNANVPDFIHDTHRLFEACASCTDTERARLHNVFIPEFNHSDPFVGLGHPRTFWLPYLWGIDPGEYRDFVDLCTVAARREAENDRLGLSIVEAELRERFWYWAGSSLEQHVQKTISVDVHIDDTANERVARLVDRAIRLIWSAVSAASAECDRLGDGDARLKLRLHPQTAVTFAVGSIIGEVPA